MSKISSIQNVYLSNINKVKLEEEKQVNKKSETSLNETSDSVITKVKPELETVEDAGLLADKITSKIQESPSSVLSAQGNLDEARILALLDEDD